MITTQSQIDQAQQARDRDNQLIAQYMTGELTLLGIADMNSMTLKELIEWSKQPHIEALLSDIAQASALRAQRLAADAAPHAIAKLTQLLSAKNEETARRAASAILRASKPGWHGQSSARVQPPSQREALGVGSLPFPPKDSNASAPSPESRTHRQRPSNSGSTPESPQPHLSTEDPIFSPSRVIRTARPVEDNPGLAIDPNRNPYRAALDGHSSPRCSTDTSALDPPELASGRHPADKQHVLST